MKEPKLLPETQFVLNLINKVSNNPRDAAYGKKEIDIYRQLTEEAINELRGEGYQINSWEVIEGFEGITKPSDGVYHIVSWK